MIKNGNRVKFITQPIHVNSMQLGRTESIIRFGKLGRSFLESIVRNYTHKRRKKSTTFCCELAVICRVPEWKVLSDVVSLSNSPWSLAFRCHWFFSLLFCHLQARKWVTGHWSARIKRGKMLLYLSITTHAVISQFGGPYSTLYDPLKF